MSVLPYRARRFVRHNLTWQNIRFQWAVVGLVVFAITNLPWHIIHGKELTTTHYAPFFLPIMLLGWFVAMQFLLTAYQFPNPTHYPWAVQKYDDLKDWWAKVSRPARIGTFEGKSILERRDHYDFRSIYDLNGRLIATEQTINWSDTDPDWTRGDPEDVEIIVNRYDNDEHLPWLALWRTKKGVA